jgi:hypothetical protein
MAGVAIGAAEITVPGQPAALRAGGSATPYGLALPAGAHCPGDSAHKGYHVFSYLVPDGVSPQSVRFSDIPDRGLGFFSNGVYVGAINTAQYTGAIIDLPTDLTLSRLTPTTLFAHGSPATWEGGIACADSRGAVTNYWNTQIVFTASASDPGGFRWSVASPVQVTSSGGLGLWVAIALIVVAAAFSLMAVRFRRSAPNGGDHGGN